MEEKLEEVVEETTQEQVEETPIKETSTEETPKVDLSKFESADDDSVIKVDLNNPPTEKTIEETSEKTEEVIEENTNVLEEVTEEETTEVEEIAAEAEEAITESMETGEPLPENIQKLMDFMEETGGDLSDYVKLNQDYSKLEDQDLLHEYYKQTKPHLNQEEINFLMEDQFSFDEDMDDERDIRRKKLALKEQVASAKSHLDGQKSKYYAEIKAGSKLTSEQKEAVNFYDKHKKETATTEEYNEKAKNVFLNRTNKFFGDKFKGFEYNVGEKRFRFNVKDADQLKDTQSDINNFIGKFLDKNNLMQDEAGYHKSLFTAMNPDTVANHFYEQGKADALKDSMARSKNVDMSPRQQFGEVKDNSGMKFRVLQDDQSPTFKFKTKNK